MLLETMQPIDGAPLWQLLYGSFSAAANGFRPLTPSQSFCDVKPLQPHQLACASAGVQLLPAAPAALMQPLLPSCGPCRPHAAPATLMRPLLPSFSPCRPHAAPAALMRPLRIPLQQPAEAHEAWQSTGFVPLPCSPLLPSSGASATLSLALQAAIAGLWPPSLLG
jgi:hypothetical protein